MGCSIVVAMTQRAWSHCFNRFGRWEPVLMWAEFKAWGEAADSAPDDEARRTVMKEGLDYFVSRMKR